jgi:uncharacterized Fe-S cluster protein YjdI
VLVGIVPEGATRIDDPDARRLVDLGDSVYTLMLRTFAQVFAPVPLGRHRRADLSAVATDLMYAVTRIAETATELPCSGDAAARAGLTLALPASIGQLVPSAATRILRERTVEIAAAARVLERVHPRLRVSDRLDDIAERLGALGDLLPVAAAPVAKPATAPPTAPIAADSDDPNTASTEAITLRFDGQRCIHSRFCVLGQPRVFLANVQGPWLHPEAASTDALVEVAHRCPSGAARGQRRVGPRGRAVRAARRPRDRRPRRDDPSDAVSLREVEEQAVLRQQPPRRGLHRDRRAGHHRVRAAGGTRRPAADHADPGRAPGAAREPGAVLGDRPDGAAPAQRALVPLRRLRHQAVLRRDARADRLPLGVRLRARG